jgi:diguanylate cyclase (GGDEF)-like protein/PAS domain S-box-containing protein
MSGIESGKVSNSHDPLRVLFVEDVPEDAELARREISKTIRSFVSKTVESREDFLRELEAFSPDIIISDYRMPRFSGLQALNLALERTPFTPVIVLTGAINEDTAVECMKAGASDYVIKEHIKRLGQAIVHGLKEAQTRRDRARAEAAVRHSEEKYRSILNNITEGYFECDLKGNIVFANDAGCAMMGYERETLYKTDYRQYIRPEAIKRYQETYRSVYKTGASSKLEDFEIILNDGTIRVREIAVSLIRDTKGKPSGFATVARDVTEQKRAEEALQRSEERLRVLFQNIPVPTFVWKVQNDRFVLTEYNAAAVQFIGEKIEDLGGKAADQTFKHMPQIPIDIHKCISLGRTVESQYWFIFDELSKKKYVVVKYAFAPPDSVLMHVNDITGQKQAEESLQFASIHDSLTGLYNRFYADAEIIRLSGGRIRPVSIILIDLNDLKKINDKYGHVAGDLYIKNTATILKQSFRTEDMIARIGGDEFLVLLPLMDETACTQAVDRLYENVEIFNKNNQSEISLAAGSATVNGSDNISEFIRIADKRMYHEKACIKSGSVRPSDRAGSIDKQN